ncbi:MAG: hypothetical protein IPJ40_14160 [Saprospirales bacterium]|nr:hypothetical protein [Saprospirales bacterium]
MGILDRLFGKDEADKSGPSIKFGRYTDSYKQPDQYKAWDKSLQAFEQGDYMESYRTFFSYLRDEELDNVRFRETADGIEFELFQGSKKVMGIANLEHLKAEAKVAKTQSMNIGFLRRLIDHNYDLKYSRFALDKENNISIVFDTYSLDGSPYKIYYGLKEMAANADKQDDLLLDEFAVLQSIETDHLKDLPEGEKEAKYQYIQQEIQRVFASLDSGKPDPQQFPGAMVYQLLHLCYKLDFLTKPEGHMMEVLERIHRLYFSKDERNTLQKAHLLRKEFQKTVRPAQRRFFQGNVPGAFHFWHYQPCQPRKGDHLYRRRIAQHGLVSGKQISRRSPGHTWLYCGVLPVQLCGTKARLGLFPALLSGHGERLFPAVGVPDLLFRYPNQGFQQKSPAESDPAY